jgi:methylated-DNA-[protein]-cysteine S-methyltransferase
MRSSSFYQAVITVVKNIPAGSVMSYGQVARAAGSPKAARAVGAILKSNTDRSIPCHRVIKSDGSLGQYNGLRGNKEQLLNQEGYRILQS